MKNFKIFFWLIPLILGIYIYRNLIFGQVLYCCDNALITIPARQYLFTELLQQGRYPLWNPYLLSGMPFLADINLSPLYPLVFVELFLSTTLNWFQVITGSFLLHTIIAWIGWFFVSGLFSRMKLARIITASLFIFSGTYLTYANNLPMVYVVAWSPWVIWSMIRYYRKPTSYSFLVASIVSAIQVVAGHPQLTFYTWGFVLVYLLLVHWRSIGLVLLRVSSVGVIVALITAIQWLPLLELSTLSTRSNVGIEYSSQGALPVGMLLRLVMPAIVGNPLVGTDWWQGGAVYGYVGVISLLVILIAGFKTVSQRALTLIGGLSLLAALGSATPVFTLLYWLVPGIRLFRVPAHFVLLVLFTVGCLLPQAIEAVASARFIKGWRWISVGFVWLTFSLLLVSIWSESVYRFITSFIIHPKFEYLGLSGFQTIVSEVLLFSASLTVISAMVVMVPKKFRTVVLGIGLLLEVAIISQRSLITIPASEPNRWLNEVVSKPTSQGRVILIPEAYASGIVRIFGEVTISKEMAYQFFVERPNLGIFRQQLAADGYASMIVRDYQSLFGVSATDPTGVTIPLEKTSVMDELAIDTIIGPKGAKEDRPTALPILRIHQEDGKVIPLQNETDNPSHIKVVLPKGTTSGVVTYATALYPGWQILVDSQLVQIEGPLLSTKIRKPAQVVEFIYRSRSVIWGSRISLVGLFLLILILVLRHKPGNQRQVQDDTSNN